MWFAEVLRSRRYEPNGTLSGILARLALAPQGRNGIR
jgi:hypothetical protein